MSISKAIEFQDPFEPESDLPDGNIQSQEQWKKLLLSIESWLFNRDPYDL